LAGYCAYLDVESALDLSLVESMGVNTKNLLISNPDCAENLLSMVDTLTKSGAVDVIVVDSVSYCGFTFSLLYQNQHFCKIPLHSYEIQK